MNKSKFLTYMMVGCILAFVGCDSILENTTPATSVPGEQVLTTETGVNALRSSLYSKVRASFDYTTEYFIATDAISDLTRSRPGSSRFISLNQLVGTDDGATDGLSSYGSTYDIILDANLMISAVGEDVLPAETLSRYRGEAFALRAMTMHHLVRALGYEPGMAPSSGPGAGFDLGIVIRTEPTQDLSNVAPQARATVSEVYTQILNDLGQAKTLLSGVNSNKTFITEAYVDGLTARVNLYAGNWDAANSAAQDAINNSGITLSNTAAVIGNMFDETGPNHPEALFLLVVNPDTEPIAGSNVNSGPAAYVAEQWHAQLPTNRVIDAYEEDDFRLGWFAPCFNSATGTAPADCDDVNDEGFELQKFNGELGNFADNLPYMRLSEMYLIQAEAAAKAANSPAAGVAPLNTLRQARNASAVPATALTDIDSFEDFILEERIRELTNEGHRWWDLKRLGRNIPNPDGSIKIRYQSFHILDDLGAGVLSPNDQLVENPGY